MTIPTSQLMDFVMSLSTNGKVWVVYEETGLVKEFTVGDYIDLKGDGKLDNTLVRGTEVQAELESLRILRMISRAS